MPKADTKNRNLARLHQFLQVIHSRPTVRWVTGTIGDKDTVKVLGDVLYGVVGGKASD